MRNNPRMHFARSTVKPRVLTSLSWDMNGYFSLSTTLLRIYVNVCADIDSASSFGNAELRRFSLKRITDVGEGHRKLQTVLVADVLAFRGVNTVFRSYSFVICYSALVSKMLKP